MNKKINRICDKISHVQQYECQKILYDFCVDKCLYDEIKWLNDNGIQTTGCCCGKHINMPPNHILSHGEINVSEDCIDKMIKLGYNYWVNKFGVYCFIPKTQIKENK